MPLEQAKKQVGSFWSYLYPKKEDIQNQLIDVMPEINANDISATTEEIKAMASSVSKNKTTWQDWFNILPEGKKHLAQLGQQMEGQIITTEGVVKANQQARASALAHNEAIKAQTFSAKAGKVALQALAMAGNMIAMWAISKGIELVVKGIDNVAHSAEHCKERVDELMSSYQSAIDKANSNAKTVEDLASKYEELSKGVNNLGENVSLTADEYSEYNDIVNQIADMFPTLIQGYTNEGNAILSLKGNVEKLRDAYKETQQEAYNLLIADGKDSDGNDIIANYQNRVNSNFNFVGVMDESGARDIINILTRLTGALTPDEFREAYSQLQQEYESIWSTDKKIQDALRASGFWELVQFNKYAQLTPEDLASVKQSAKTIIQTYQAEIDLALRGVKLLANAYLMTNEDYAALNDQSKNIVSVIVNSINEDLANGFEDKIAVGTYVNNILDTIKDNIDLQDALYDFSTLDYSSLSVNDATLQINSYISAIADAINLTPLESKFAEIHGLDDIEISELKLKKVFGTNLIDFKSLFGFEDIDNINTRLQNAIRILTDDRGIQNREILNSDEYAELVEIVNKLTIDEAELCLKAINDAENVTDAISGIKKALELIDAEEDDSVFSLSISQTVDQLNTRLKPALDSLSSAWNDIFTDDGFVLNSIEILSTCDSIKSKLDDLSEIEGITVDYSSFEDFVRVLSNSESESEDVERAFESLATSIAQVALSGTEDFDTMKAALEDLGIVNNEIVAFDALVRNTEALKEAGLDLADSGYEQMKAFAEERISAENLTQAIAILTYQKKLCDLQGINTSSEVANLRTLAENAGYTGEVIQYLTELEQIYQQVENGTIDPTAMGEKIDRIVQLKTLIESATSKIDYKPIEKAASSAGKSAAESFTNALDKELAALDKKMEACYINFDDYVQARLALIEDYYKQGKLSADEYYSYLEKHYDTQLSYMDKVVNSVTRRIDTELDALKQQKEDVENIYNVQIDSLEKEKTLLEETNRERQRQKDLQTSLYDMEQAKNQRTQLVYTEGRGMHYAADDQAVRDAQENVDNARYDIQIAEIEKSVSNLEDARDKETSAIDDMISDLEAYKDAWSDVTSTYATEQENLIAAQILGADWETDILSSRLDVLNDFKNQYISIQQEMTAAWKSADEQAKLSAAVKEDTSDPISVASDISDQNSKEQKNTPQITKISGGGGDSNKLAFADFQAYASGTDNARKGLNLVGEDGAEAYFDNHGHVAIVTEPTLIPMEGGEVVKNERDTKKLLDPDNLAPANTVDFDDIDGKEVKHTRKVNAEAITLSDGTVLTPVQPGSKMYDMMRRFNTYWGNTDKNTEKFAPDLMYEHNRQMHETVNQLIGNNSMVNHNKNMQPSVTQNITLTCPNVTNNSGVEYIQRELGNLSQMALQESMKR